MTEKQDVKLIIGRDDNCPFRKVSLCNCESNCDYEKFESCFLDETIEDCEGAYFARVYPGKCPLLKNRYIFELNDE